MGGLFTSLGIIIFIPLDHRKNRTPPDTLFEK
jgi:hypothetical protein